LVAVVRAFAVVVERAFVAALRAVVVTRLPSPSSAASRFSTARSRFSIATSPVTSCSPRSLRLIAP
jgi:hypothetical protein